MAAIKRPACKFDTDGVAAFYTLHQLQTLSAIPLYRTACNLTAIRVRKWTIFPLHIAIHHEHGQRFYIDSQSQQRLHLTTLV
jgi:hypothetical protein